MMLIFQLNRHRRIKVRKLLNRREKRAVERVRSSKWRGLGVDRYYARIARIIIGVIEIKLHFSAQFRLCAGANLSG